MRPDARTPDVQATTDVPLLASRYRLLDKLGQGGMGAVFRARDTNLDRDVAVKMLPEGSAPDADAVARFRREARALARLTHPGIIPAYDSGEENGRPFLVMELVDGRSLAAVVHDQGRIGPARAADFAYQAALALQYAHQGGLVHRDVKPSNLLLSADGRVRLLDLGLARFLQDQIGEAALTRTGTGMGTPDYCPPEQFHDARKADVRSDVYALGCTLYHLIAGRVPFPGSSFSEKVEAHEKKEAAPLEELCPEVPGGLALAVRKMMAKRPAERFQTMAEVAETLMPHVAGSSASFPQIRNTTTWDGSHLSTIRAMPRRRLVPWLIAGMAVALLLVAVGVATWTAGWFRPGSAQVAHNPEPDPLPADHGKAVQPVEPGLAKLPDDPNVLTVSQKPEGGGKYQTIAAALDAVQPGQTIRVLDGEVYRERLAIKRASRQAGITLEAPGGAILETTTPRSLLIDVSGVPGVTLRQLRLRASNTERCTLVAARGKYPGLRLEGLELSFEGTGSGNNGVELYGAEGASTDQDPVVVRGCRFHRLAIAVVVGTELADDRMPPVARTAVRDGIFLDCSLGVKVVGKTSDVQVVGNRFRGMTFAAIQLETLAPESKGILVANNTCLEGTVFRLWDSAARGKEVRVCNNLVLGAPELDMFHVKVVGKNGSPGPGDGAAVARAFAFDHNWREGHEPTGASAKAWIPPDPNKGDVLKETIDGVVNRDPKSPGFLRPDKDAALAAAGAGNEDPSLPRYVGALPPEGTDLWDWDRAWRMPKDAQLLTVSREEKGGGKYRTINAALQDAKPWATIRVLDAATYPEAISLTDRKKYEGLTLEAVSGAKLHLAGTTRRLVTITDVPHVRVTGFQFTESAALFDRSPATRAFVVVSGNVPGVALTRLRLAPKVLMLGLVLQNPIATADEPLRIEDCTIRPSCPMSNDGISVSGSLDKDPARGICIRSNRIFNSLHGIILRGIGRDIHVVGNLTVNCPACGIQLEDLSPLSHGLLVANNTVVGGEGGFRVWDNAPYEEPVAGQVEVTNNLVLAAAHCDVAYILDPGKEQIQSPGDGKALIKLWRFHHNRRDFSGARSTVAIPPGSDDARLVADDLVSQDADKPDRVRPAKDSPLAMQGAGTKDSNLPRYIGALPCDGDAAWDWDRTWRARVQKTGDKK
jgi:serine/threonine protein kinase